MFNIDFFLNLLMEKIVLDNPVMQAIVKRHLSLGDKPNFIIENSEGGKTICFDRYLMTETSKKLQKEFENDGIEIEPDTQNTKYLKVSVANSKDSLCFLKPVSIFESVGRAISYKTISSIAATLGLLSFILYGLGIAAALKQLSDYNLYKYSSSLFSLVNAHQIIAGLWLLGLGILSILIWIIYVSAIFKYVYKECSYKIGLYKRQLILFSIELWSYCVIIYLVSKLPDQYSNLYWLVVGVFAISALYSVLLMGKHQIGPFCQKLLCSSGMRILTIGLYMSTLVYFTHNIKFLHEPDHINLHFFLVAVIMVPIFIFAMQISLLIDIDRETRNIKVFWFKIRSDFLSIFSLIAFLGIYFPTLVLNQTLLDPVAAMRIGDFNNDYIINDDLRAALEQAIPYRQNHSQDQLNSDVGTLLKTLNQNNKYDTISPWVVADLGDVLAISCGQDAAYSIVLSTNPYRFLDVRPTHNKADVKSDKCQEFDHILSASS